MSSRLSLPGSDEHKQRIAAGDLFRLVELLEFLGFTIEADDDGEGGTFDCPDVILQADLIRAARACEKQILRELQARKYRNENVLHGGPLDAQNIPCGWFQYGHKFEGYAIPGRRAWWAVYRRERWRDRAVFVGHATSHAKARRGDVTNAEPPAVRHLRLLPRLQDGPAPPAGKAG